MSFTDKIAGQEVSDYHLITTNHPYLISLGLGMMTTGTLYEWWNDHTGGGEYLNRMSVNNRDEINDPPNGVETLLGISSNTEFFWYGWKPHSEFKNTGRYQKQDLSDYGTGFGGDNPWEFDSAIGTVDVSNLAGESVIGDHNKPYTSATLDGSLNFQPNSLAPVQDTLKGMAPIYDIINLNRYMSLFTDYYPRALWEKDDPTIGGVTTSELYANHELLTEIKSSKIGPYIEWSGEITFNVNENNGTVNCPITEWASFKLYLFDRASSQSENKIVTVKNLTYVAPKRDVTGRTFSSSEDGGHREYDPDAPSTRGAADIDVSYNSITKKWESGTPQLFAKLVTNIGTPDSMPTVKYFETNNIEEDLSSEDYKSVKIIPASGTAMPIRPQNGNPNQWQPNYLDSDDVRCAEPNLEKETVTVYNFNTRRSFERDEEVLLSRIDGQWHVFPIWAGNDVEDETVTSDVGKWGEFSYLFTNSDYFFRAEDGGQFSPREAEQSFHADYYSGDDLNDGVDYGVDGGYDYAQPFTNKNIRKITFRNGFAQQTSFDYLDSILFGIRSKKSNITGESSDNKCSISTTSAVVNAAGQVIPSPSEYTSRNAAHAGVFFGCIFPDGYIGVDDYLDAREWDVVPRTSGNDRALASNYIETTVGNGSVKIFDADNATDSRNNCRQPATAEPTGDIGGSKWSRYDSRASANLFAEYELKGLTTFKQIPADVMTNASPKGDNGSPIQPIGRFEYFHRSDAVGSIVSQNAARKAFLQGVWLGKEGGAGSTNTITYTNEDSAFDFTPVSRNHLTFRPCKLENYIQFGKKNAANWFLSKDLSQGRAQENRLGFHVEANRTQLDDKRPCTYFFEDREEPNVSTRLLDDYGLLWGGNVENKPRYNNLHEFNYWDSSQGAMRWTRGLSGDWRGAGAFGVITTFNTVTANSQIDFTTDNIFGMGAAAHGRFSIQNGYAAQDRTWGVSSFIDSYRQENIVDLSIRMYQQHPREQLLFDPRTYAVHHFNPDVRYTDDYYTKDNGQIETLNPVRKIETEVVKGMDPNGESIEFNYNYPLPSSEVDFQEVCRYERFLSYPEDTSKEHEEGKSYSAQPLTTSSYILSDSTIENGVVEPRVTPTKFWKVNTSRVGKLLPFNYHRKEVGIPTPTGKEFGVDDGVYAMLAVDLSDTPVVDIVNFMIVKNQGADYKKGDIIGNESKGISFTVKSVGSGGEVITLECTNPGTGFKASESASRFAIFNPGTKGPIEIKTLQSGSGGGFDAYYVASLPYEKLYTDPKPFLMKRDGEEIVRIAADVPQGTHQTAGGSSEAENGAFANESRDVTYILDPTLQSENKQYDVFFHFHNDITMTWLASSPDFHGDARNSTECAEQHVTVRINPR